MTELIIVAKRVINPNQCIASWELPHHVREYYDLWTKQQIAKGINFDKLIIKKPFQARSKGKKSQNHHANGHCQQLCMILGWDMEVMRFYTKKLAVSRGYPFDTDPDGSVIPWGETRIDIEQCGYWIEAIHQFADENDIRLREE